MLYFELDTDNWKRPMLCPKCGEPMNHHADKLVAPTDANEAEWIDTEFDGVIHETHSCPRCGSVEFRLADPEGSGEGD